MAVGTGIRGGACCTGKARESEIVQNEFIELQTWNIKKNKNQEIIVYFSVCTSLKKG
jgi:hypothetical protein